MTCLEHTASDFDIDINDEIIKGLCVTHNNIAHFIYFFQGYPQWRCYLECTQSCPSSEHPDNSCCPQWSRLD